MTERAGSEGYALTEALVAMVIAAATVTAAMSGLASAARGARAADMRQQDVLEQGNIAARLRAGLPVQQIVDRYDRWSVILDAAERPVDPVTGAVLTRARIARRDGGGTPLEIVFLESGALQARAPR